MADYHIDTRCVQAGYHPENGEPRVPAIVQSTTFRYESSTRMGNLFDLEEEGFFYTRLANPTASHVEAKIADLEGGSAALLTASGQAAVTLAILNLCKAGDHIIATSALYGGTFNLFSRTLPDMGIQVDFVANDCSDATLAAAFRPETKLVFGEMLANPSLAVLDLERFARAAHAHGVPLIVDNTFPTPIHCQPLAFGADIVVHSTSKYLDGHARALGGVLVEKRATGPQDAFHWQNGKFPMLSEPDTSYHGIIFTDHFAATPFTAKARLRLMRDLGPTPAPFNAFLLSMGLETLALRMERHVANARRVATWLSTHADVAWVHFPELASSPWHALAQRYMPHGTCGVITFGVNGGREAAIRFMDALRLAAIVTHVADVRTSVLHPASTTHRQLDDAALVRAGASADMIRLSVGIEHVDDIIADLDQALSAARI